MKVYFNSIGQFINQDTSMDMFVKGNNGNVVECYFKDLDISDVNLRFRLVIKWSDGTTTNELPMSKSLKNDYVYLTLPILKIDGEAQFIIRIYRNTYIEHTAIFKRSILEGIDASDDTVTTEEYEVLLQNIDDIRNIKQDVLKSGKNIKTINGMAITGEGNIDVVTTGDRIWIRYAEDVLGTNMSSVPLPTHEYMGTYTGVTPSANASDYVWVKYSSELTTVADGAITTEKLEQKLGLKIKNSSLYNINWSYGYLMGNGDWIDSNEDNGRSKTDYILCDENVEITYYGESDHSAINVLSFYDNNKNYISGISNVGLPMVRTATTPIGTKYIRLSTSNAYLNNSFVSFSNAVYGNYIGKLIGQEAPKNEVYISYAGSDSNDGTKNNPVRTFSRALSMGYKKLRVKRGVYNEIINISNLDEIEIIPSDYGTDYSHGVDRENIVIDGAEYLDTLNAVSYTGNVKYISYSNIANNYNLKSVFVDGSNPPMSGYFYRAVVWTVHNDSSLDFKLTPKSTLDQVISTENSFMYYDGKIYFNTTDTSIIKLAIPMNDPAMITFTNCNKVKLIDVEQRYSLRSNFSINNCNDIVLENCKAKFATNDMGYLCVNVNGIFNNCYATKVGTDGFNFHGYGTTTMNNCVAEYNYDDGCSHHDKCDGFINGGVFNNNGKAGIAPAYGANININNVIAKNNPIGIGYLTTENGHRNMYGYINSCCLVNNNNGLKVDELCIVDAVNVKYANNTVDKVISGILTEF